MVDGYCVKCRAKRTMKSPKLGTTARGGKMVQGKCEKCGTKMTKFVKKDFKL